MNGGESARRLYELNELGVVPNNPLFAMRACDGRLEGEGLPVLVKLRTGADRSREAGEAREGEGRIRPVL